MSVTYRKGHVRSFEKYLLLVSLVIPLISADCVPYPIPVRIGNVTLSNQQIARGMTLSVGSPQQSFAFLPQSPVNNSFVYGINGFCSDGWSATGCTTFRGGQYDENASTSRGTAAPGSYPNDTLPFSQSEWVTDSLALNSNVTLEKFPIGIALADWGEQGYQPQMTAGLGPNSSILQTLRQAGQIASHSWSMFWGLNGGTSSTQMDGIFVFGGYDRAKVKGANYTQNLVDSGTNCSSGMLVTITDMTLDFTNGTSVSLFGSAQSTAMSACIMPFYPSLMTLPYDPYFIRFEQYTNITISSRSFGVDFYNMIYDVGDAPYTGDLTFQLSSGLSVRIPNDQLVVPYITVDEQTGQRKANYSTPELVINSIQQINENDLPQLGRQFLSAAYLMLNQDTNSFTLWEASPTTNQDIVAIDDNNQVWDTFCSGSPKAPPPASSSPPPPPASTGNSLSGGAIAGIVVGSVVGLAAIAGLLFFFSSKKPGAPTPDKHPLVRFGMIPSGGGSDTPPYELHSKPVTDPLREPQELATNESRR